MSERIEGKVARVIDSRSLVINRGRQAGVQIGMRFSIVIKDGTTIPDPDTGEPLGTIDLQKTVVKVIEVQENLSVARTFRTIPGSKGFAAFGPTPDRDETFKASDTTVNEEFSAALSAIAIGDAAIQISSD